MVPGANVTVIAQQKYTLTDSNGHYVLPGLHETAVPVAVRVFKHSVVHILTQTAITANTVLNLSA